jgi:hypothetical protein
VSGRWLGTTSTADFLPTTVEALPKPEKTLVDMLVEGRPIDRVNRKSIPPGTEVVTETVTPLHARYHSTGNRDYLLRLFLFDFPGWEAKIDGEQVGIELGRPEGFIVVPVPAGSHTVDVHFGNTPARLLAAVISGLSVAGVLVVGLRLKSVGSGQLAVNGSMSNGHTRGGERLLWAVGGVVIVIFWLYVLVLGPSGALHFTSRNYVADPAENHVVENFGEQIALIGYDVPDKLELGEQLDTTFYWQAWQPLSINFQVFVHLLAEDGSLVAQSDKLNPGDFPTRRWPVDKYVRDEHTLEVPADLAPGIYRLSVGLWVAKEGWRLPLLDDSRNQIGDNYVVKDWMIEVD